MVTAWHVTGTDADRFSAFFIIIRRPEAFLAPVAKTNDLPLQRRILSAYVRQTRRAQN